ncbi:PilZ domain-containing protein [Rhizobium sp. 9140]|nr:PilZ domain-containing protein [Rhizobium sp. 9140]
MEPTADRRRHPRTVRIWSGRLLADGVAVDCAVSDVAEGGLRVNTEVEVVIPAETVIQHPDGMRRCVIRWQKLNEIGVSFIE